LRVPRGGRGVQLGELPVRADGARIAAPHRHRQLERAQHAGADFDYDGAGRPQHPQHGQQVQGRDGIHARRPRQRGRPRRDPPHRAHPGRALDPRRSPAGRMSDPADELGRLRAAIDRVDDSILENLNERARLARAIGTLKVGQAYRPEREAQVLTRLKEMNPGPLSGETVAYLFREVMSACLALERPISVAYLGPKGTFSERAAVKHFGIAAVTQPSDSIDEVFRAVESGASDFGVVPVENSTEGAVGRSLDLMPQTPMKVCGEVV